MASRRCARRDLYLPLATTTYSRLCSLSAEISGSRLSSLGSSRLLVGSAADLFCSCWPSCCCHIASSLAAVNSARTTARQLPESWHDAIVVLLAVRLAVVHDVSGASAQPSAAERRLMVWPLGCEKGLHTSFPSDPLGMQSCRQHKMCVKSRDKHNGTFGLAGLPR